MSYEMPTTVRDLRHYIDKQTHKVHALVQGQPGLSKEDQIQRVKDVNRVTGWIVQATAALLLLVSERDFDAHQKAKADTPAEVEETDDEDEEVF